SIFSDMNNLEVVSITSDLYADSFGFTEQEVFTAMSEQGLTNKDEVKYWYDGFSFGDKREIYNPWSIINYLAKRRIAPYWANSSSTVMLEQMIYHADIKIKEEFSVLLQEKSIVTRFDEEIVFPKLYTKKGAFWSLLMASGYVKPLKFDITLKKYEIVFTNQEIYQIMNDLIYDLFNNSDISVGSFCQALIDNNIDLMNKILNNITKNIFSFFDVGGNEPERFYHAFVLGLIVDLKARYEISSNQESGNGRYDIMLIPKRQYDHGIVIEFKTIESDREKSLEISCLNALKQIHEKQYINKLLSRDIPKNNIYVYGFAFHGKNVMIKGGVNDEIDFAAL
ncbi:MAG: PD-(D/E)XK nuclease domain-containing protein, partial [Desulfovibrio sp.]|nr:PD-(D/E)XK nuclease domain-containing protein [Desulfovibrio sp.]